MRFFGARLLLLLAIAGAGRAQTITSIYDTSLPGGHTAVIGLTVAGSDLYLYTTESYYTSPVYNGGLSFTKGPIDFATDLNIRLTSLSLVATNPATPNIVYLSGGFGATNLLYTFQLSPAAQTNVPIQSVAAKPLGLAWSPALGTVVITTTDNELRSVNLASGVTTVIDTSAAGALSAPAQVAAGPDGRLYFIDSGNNRIVGVDPLGSLSLRTISLVAPAEASALAISASGVLFTADGNGGGDAYDLFTGAHLTNLTAGSSTPNGPGKAALVLAGSDLYVFDNNTGLHVYDVSAIPEPSTYAALAGVCALGLAILRRGRTSSS